MDMSKILVVVKFGGALIFFFFFFLCVTGNFWSCGFGHGKFFGHVILVMGIFWAYDFGHENFWSCGNFKWDKFRIHLMRSCSTNLNLSWLALMEFALMRQSWMPLVWKWMHDFFWNHEILVFYEKMMTVVLFWKWIRHGWMPLFCRLMHDFWKLWYLRKTSSKWMRQGRMPLV